MTFHDFARHQQTVSYTTFWSFQKSWTKCLIEPVISWWCIFLSPPNKKSSWVWWWVWWSISYINSYLIHHTRDHLVSFSYLITQSIHQMSFIWPFVSLFIWLSISFSYDFSYQTRDHLLFDGTHKRQDFYMFIYVFIHHFWSVIFYITFHIKRV